MDIADLISKAVAEGWATLAVVGIAAVYQTRELRACRLRDDECTRNLGRVRVGIARLYSITKARLGEADPIPPLDELMSERRGPQV